MRILCLIVLCLTALPSSAADRDRKAKVALAFANPCTCETTPGRCERVAAVLVQVSAVAPKPAPKEEFVPAPKSKGCDCKDCPKGDCPDCDCPTAKAAPAKSPAVTIGGVPHVLGADGYYRPTGGASMYAPACPNGRCPNAR